MRMSKLVPVVLALQLGLIMPVTAQEAVTPEEKPESTPQLDEIIVTAQKREKRLQDVPMAISAFGRDAIESNEISNIEDLTKLVPSLRVTPADDPTNTSLRIRGVGTDVYSIAVEPNVSVVVDEVPLARTAIASFEFADLERVEVMRGPQGTLFGKNSTAGLIHVISRDPAQDFEAFARAVREQPNDLPGSLTNFQAGASGPVSDSVGLRLTGFYKFVGGHLENVQNGENLPDRESYGARGKFMWDGDAMTVRLNTEYQRSTGPSTPFVPRTVNPGVASRSPEIAYGEENTQTKAYDNAVSDVDNFGTSLKVDWDLGPVTLTSITGWRYFYILRDFTVPEVDGDRINLPRNGGDRDIQTLTQEVRITSNDAGAFEYTVGALWFQNRLRNYFERRITNVPTTYLLVAGSPAPLPYIVLPEDVQAVPGESFGSYERTRGLVRSRNLGVFAQSTWHATERLHFTAGARFIYEKQIGERESHSHLYNETTGVEFQQADFNIKDASIDDQTVIGTFSVQYDVAENARIYGTISTGYRGGAFDFASSNPEEAFANPVDPETSLSFELGSKSRLFDNRLEINVAVFRTVFEDFQAQITDLGDDDNPLSISALAFRLDNAGELETKGIEIDFQARPAASLFMFGSLLYADAKFNEFETQCFVGQEPGENGGVDADGNGTCDSQSVAGGRMPNAPKWSASLSGRYEHQIIGNGGLAYLQVTGRYVGEVQFSAEQHPGAIHDAYQVWDTRLGWVGLEDRLEVAFYVKNVFDQHYVSAIVPFSITNDRRDLAHFVPRDSDRNFGLSVGYQF